MGDTILPQGAGYGVIIGTLFFSLKLHNIVSYIDYRHRFILQRVHANCDGHSGTVHSIFTQEFRRVYERIAER